MFRTPERDVHVHLWVAGSSEVTRHLAFRDRLRASAADRRAYSDLKRRLAEREWHEPPVAVEPGHEAVGRVRVGGVILSAPRVVGNQAQVAGKAEREWERSGKADPREGYAEPGAATGAGR